MEGDKGHVRKIRVQIFLRVKILKLKVKLVLISRLRRILISRIVCGKWK